MLTAPSLSQLLTQELAVDYRVPVIRAVVSFWVQRVGWHDPHRECTMGIGKKIKDKAQKVKGKTKEKIGGATG
jgi:hypothetical protein